ncbi:MAG: trimethylamine methyltransferase family protein [Thermoleophilia bacterium]
MKRNLFAGRPRSGGLSLNVFTESELEDIHLATLEVLERTGVFVEADEAIDLFADGGCLVDRESHIVRIPPYVVEDAIRSAPSKFVLCGRESKNDIVLEPGRVAFTNFSEGIRVVDPQTGELRDSTKADIADIARLNDYLSDIETFEIAVGAKDVPPETCAVHNAEAQYLNTTKPIGIGPLSRTETVAIFRMAAEIVGGADELRRRPIVYNGVCPVSPLKLPHEATEVIIESARWWIPNNILSMAMAGGSSPVTLAGTLVTHNAEVLSGITLAQLTERGAPCIYGSSTTAMDLKLAAACVGSPELAMISAAVAQMARRYLLPSFVAGL